MQSYNIWEAICVWISLALMVGYHVVIRGRRICTLQAFVRPLWTALHQQRKSTSSITAIQNLRNIIAICTMFATPCLTFAVLSARLGATASSSSASFPLEMLIVTGLWALAFIQFGIAANAAHYLIFNIGLYPLDKTDTAVVPLAAVHDCWERSNRQLTVVGRHVALGERVILIAIPATFIAIHPAAFLCATVASCALWYYADRRFGVRLGNVDVLENASAQS